MDIEVINLLKLHQQQKQKIILKAVHSAYALCFWSSKFELIFTKNLPVHCNAQISLVPICVRTWHLKILSNPKSE